MSDVIRDALQAWKVGRHPIFQGQYDEAIAELDRLEAAAATRQVLAFGPDDTLILRIHPDDAHFDPENNINTARDLLLETRAAVGHDRVIVAVTGHPIDAIVLRPDAETSGPQGDCAIHGIHAGDECPICRPVGLAAVGPTPPSDPRGPAGPAGATGPTRRPRCERTKARYCPDPLLIGDEERAAEARIACRAAGCPPDNYGRSPR